MECGSELGMFVLRFSFYSFQKFTLFISLIVASNVDLAGLAFYLR